MSDKLKSSASIDWAAIIAANKEPEQLEINTKPKNYYLDDKTIEAYQNKRNLHAHTRACYDKEIRQFGEYLEAIGTTEPVKMDCDQYLIQRRNAVSPGAARQVRSILKQFGAFLRETGRAGSNVWTETDEAELRIRREDSEEHLKRQKGLYTLDDVAEILRAIHNKDMAALSRLIH